MIRNDSRAALVSSDKRFVELGESVASMVTRFAAKEEACNEKIGELERLEERLDAALKAKVLIQVVAHTTQAQLEYHISGLVSLAEAGLFSNPYEFSIEFVQRRNKTECDFYFVRDGNKVDPLSTGGGVLDVGRYALRCSFWSLNKNRRLLVLDEPFRYVSADLQEKCAAMVKTVSEKLDIQVIMISHLPGIVSVADKMFRVTQSGGVSKVEELA